MKTVSILGATGSIGEQTLDIIRQQPESFALHGVAVNQQIDKLIKICQEFQPAQVVLADASKQDEFEQKLTAATITDYQPQVLMGEAGLITLSEDIKADTIVSAIVGAAGLLPTLAAIKADKRVLLANKESLVMAGEVMMNAVRESNGVLLPIDSEHNAIFQCLSDAAWEKGLDAGGVEKLILTASGGPFLNFTADQLRDVTPEQACKHPKWSMGRKISVDSATLMNKGLEVIEAFYLFQAKQEQIHVVVHPQSIVHSFVEYKDGSVLAQLGQPDMRTPIAYAMSYPERLELDVPKLNWQEQLGLEFMPPDIARFPCLGLAFDALKAGGLAPAVLNAANEVAVDAFLSERISFTDIAKVNEYVMGSGMEPRAAMTFDNELEPLEQVIEADMQARECAISFIAQLTA